MGVVYEAWQEDLGRAVAVKLITAPGPDALVRFQREARAAAALGHPHIVQVFDFQASADEPPFLVMELLQGRSLQQLIRSEGPLPATRVARIGVHVLSALGAAHRAGIVHRDIKPANIFCATSPTLGEIAKVLDFGIAKVASGGGPKLTNVGDVVGTVAYMSPEQARGIDVDGRSDLYSLAACLYYATTRHFPINADNTGMALLAIVHGQVPPLESLRPELDPTFCSIVRRAMAVDAASRFASAEEMGEALSRWLASQQIQAGKATPGPGTGVVASLPAGAGDNPPRAYGAPAVAGAVSWYGPSEPQPLAPQGPMSAVGPISPQGPTSAAGPLSLHGPVLGAGPPGTPAAGAATTSLSGVAGRPGRSARPGLWLAVGGIALVVAGGVAAAVLLPGADDDDSQSSSKSSTGRRARAGSSATTSDTGRSPAPASPDGRPSAPVRPGAPVAQPTTPSVSPTGAPPTATAPSTTSPVSGGPGSPCQSKSGCGFGVECEAGRCQCITGWTNCGGVCRDLNHDFSNCGVCNRPCAPGQYCSTGSCNVCAGPGVKTCSGRCVDTGSDRYNCGSCGHVCVGTPCAQGVCRNP